MHEAIHKLDDKYKYCIKKHEAITKIAKTKLKPYI